MDCCCGKPDKALHGLGVNASHMATNYCFKATVENAVLPTHRSEWSSLSNYEEKILYGSLSGEADPYNYNKVQAAQAGKDE